MNGAELIAAERRRQIEQEGWTPEHDDQHSGGELATAGAVYATPANGSWKASAWPFEASFSLFTRPRRNRPMPSPDKHLEGLEEARRAAEALLPACDVCKVEYIEYESPWYEGPCQEPLAPFDGSRSCPGRVTLTPERIADRAVEAAAPAIRKQAQEEEREQMQKVLESDEFSDQLTDVLQAAYADGFNSGPPDYEPLSAARLFENPTHMRKVVSILKVARKAALDSLTRKGS